MPASAVAISPLTAATAAVTPLPFHRDLSPSRSSSASRSPVDAPDGTAARPRAPPSSTTSTSMVGLPRESRISRPRTSTIFTLTSPVRFRFELQRFFRDRADVRLVARRDHDHAAFRNRMPPPIFFGVVANRGATRDVDVAIDDGPAKPRVAPDPHP